MKLKSLQYEEYIGKPEHWKIQKFSLNNIGLFVARNATGKSRTLNVIKALSIIFTRPAKFTDCSFIALFEDDTNTYTYKISYLNSLITEELLEKDGTALITRDIYGNAKFWYQELNQMVSTKIPADSAAILRRDEIQHPYLKPLANWGENTIHYLFGTDMGKTSAIVTNNKLLPDEPDLKTAESVTFMFQRGLELFQDQFMSRIKSDMNSLGYSIEDIKLNDMSGMPNIEIAGTLGVPRCIFVKEKGIPTYIMQQNLSQGMFRALSLIINLNYVQFKKLKGCILIDDIGEGLDFERSTNLIKLLINKAENSFAQLFMTTNDKYVMNEVPLKYWNVIVRDNQTCNILNIENTRERFEEFEFTGLNNFDFLSLDFYKKDLDY